MPDASGVIPNGKKDGPPISYQKNHSDLLVGLFAPAWRLAAAKPAFVVACLCAFAAAAVPCLGSLVLLWFLFFQAAHLVGAGADFAGAKLRDAVIHNTDLSRVNFAGADLRGVDLAESTIFGANMARANLEGAQIRVGQLNHEVLWFETTCPDGSKSEENLGTCIENLSTTILVITTVLLGF